MKFSPTKYILETAALQRDYGKFLFGELMNKKEMDTPQEKLLDKLMKKWTHGSYMQRTAKEMLSRKALFSKLKKLYPDVMEPPRSPYLYRGATVSSKEFINFYTNYNHAAYKGKTSKYFGGRIKADDWKYIYHNVATYKPRSPAQSWSTDFTVAQSFAEMGDIGYQSAKDMKRWFKAKSQLQKANPEDPWKEVRGDVKNILSSINMDSRITVVFRADLSDIPKDERFFDPEVIHRAYTDNFGGMPKQNEVVRIGKQPIAVDVIVHKDIIEALDKLWDISDGAAFDGLKL